MTLLLIAVGGSASLLATGTNVTSTCSPLLTSSAHAGRLADGASAPCGDVSNSGTGSAAVIAPRYLQAEHQMMELAKARDALLAYAVTYTDNYGHGGAGPGHLPCPDRDPPDDGNPRNDGPNPPCGAASAQVGRVPRITMARNQKLLEFYPAQSFVDRQPWYIVDASFINNPHNRVVNAGTRPTLGDKAGNGIVAVLASPGGAISTRGQHRPSLVASDYLESLVHREADALGRPVSRQYKPAANDNLLPVYIKDLMPMVNRRVGFYVQQKLIAYRSQHCGKSTDVATHLEGANTPGTDSIPLVATGVETEGALRYCFPFVSELLEETGNASVQPLTRADESAEKADSEYCTLLRASDQSEKNIYEIRGCSDWLLNRGLLDGLTPRRHWFFRNQWSRYINLTISHQCLYEEEPHCEIAYVSPSVDHLDDPVIQIEVLWNDNVSA